MKAKAVSKIWLALLLIGILNLSFNVQSVRGEPRTWIVDGDGPADFHTIQEAIYEAKSGDIIIVSEGNYAEGQITLYKPLTLKADGQVIVDGLNMGHVFYVTANNVTIEGFKIKNSRLEWPYSGIFLYNVQNCNITRNNIVLNYAGIGLDESDKNYVSQNIVANSSWIGIRLVESSSYNNLKGNIVITNLVGIVLHDSGRNVLEDNYLAKNRYNFGVVGRELSHFVQKVEVSNTVNGKPIYYLLNQNDVIFNPSSFSDIGYLAIVNSTHVTAENLTLTNNGQGVLIAYTTNTTIQNVTAINNSNGIQLVSSDGNYIVGNNVTINEIGVNLFKSTNNSFFHNNFAHNVIQTYSSLSINKWDNGYPSGGNYWSDHATRYPSDEDEHHGKNQNLTGGDGVWDRPYVIDTNNRDNYPLVKPWDPLSVINADVDVNPEALNPKSMGKWITAHIELPEDYDAMNVYISSILLNERVPAELHLYKIGDYDNDGISDLLVKFDRQGVIAILGVGSVTLTIAGRVKRTFFEGTCKIKVINEQRHLSNFFHFNFGSTLYSFKQF